MTIRNWRTAGVSLAGLLVLLGALPLYAGDEDISFKKRGDAEKKFVTAVGEAILKAAHGTGRKPVLIKYEFANPKANRTDLAIKMEYRGLATGKRYVADITVKIDSTNKDSWEVLNIDYVDNNTIKANTTKIQELIKTFNK
jgi:hypothetical protein